MQKRDPKWKIQRGLEAGFQAPAVPESELILVRSLYFDKSVEPERPSRTFYQGVVRPETEIYFQELIADANRGETFERRMPVRLLIDGGERIEEVAEEAADLAITGHVVVFTFSGTEVTVGPGDTKSDIIRRFHAMLPPLPGPAARMAAALERKADEERAAAALKYPGME